MAQIFISYRRVGGEIMAQLLYEKLSSAKYDVFYDREMIPSTVFPENLYKEIESCTDFILVLPENALERCYDENDWVRKEITHALKCNKHIIPIMLGNFEFPESMPADIEHVRNHNGIRFRDMDYFDAGFERLCDSLLSKISTRVPKILKATFKAFRKAGEFLLVILSQICNFFWRFRILRFAVIFWLGFLVLYFGNEVSRDIRNVNVNQWINLKTLISDNSKTAGFTMGNDGIFPICNNYGIITIIQANGNSVGNTSITSFQTPFKGDKKVFTGMFRNKEIVYVYDSERIAFYQLNDGKKILEFDFDKDKNKNSEYIRNVSEVLINENNIIVIFDEYKKTEEHTSDEDKETTGHTLKECLIYKYDLESSDSPNSPTILDLNDCTYYLGSANSGKYILFSTTNDISIIDTEKGKFVENVDNTLKECAGQIDDTSTLKSFFSKDKKYVALFRYDNSMIVIKNLENGDIFRQAHANMRHFAFDEDGTYIVYYDKRLEDNSYSPSLCKVKYTATKYSEEVLLSAEDFVDLTENEKWYEMVHEIYKFNNSNTVLLAYDHRLHLIDLDTKRRTASCNGFLLDQIIKGYSIYETEGNIISVISSSIGENASTDFADYSNVYRFSFKEKNGNIIVVEDSYTLTDRLYWLQLICSVLALSVFVILGKTSEKEKQSI